MAYGLDNVGYDPAEREKQVLNIIYPEKEAFMKAEFKLFLDKTASTEPELIACKLPPDPLQAQLETIISEVKVLELNVDKFEGPHFTKVYRTLQGDCSKLELDLDKVNVEGRDDIRQERRKLYVKIEKLGDQLAGKAHGDGRICEICEVKE